MLRNNTEREQLRKQYKDIIRKEYWGGFECGDGWLPIISIVLKHLNQVGHEGFKVLQIKEKFGGLRIYTSYTDDRIDSIIDAAEQEARKTCEDCGSRIDVSLGYRSPGKYWVATLCKSCRRKDDESRQTK